MSLRAWPSRLLFVPGVVTLVDVGEPQWGLSVDLDHGFTLGLHVMMHRRIHVSEAAGGKGLQAGFVELVAHADLQRAGDDRHILALGMEMRRDHVPVGSLHADGVVTGRAGWIAFDDGHLRARRYERRRRTVL